MRTPEARAAGTKAKAKKIASAVPSAEDMTERLGPVWRKHIGERIVKAAKVTGQDLDQETLRKLVSEGVATEAKLLKVSLQGVDKRTRQRVEKIVSTGLSKGQRADTIAARLEGTLGPSRARAVAQTETHRASQSATFETFAALKVTRRQWVTERDSQVRSAHRAMEGQTRALDKPFKAPGGATAMCPGGFDDPALSVNCRCVVVPLKAKREAEWTDRQLEAEWRGIEEDRRRFERDAAVVIDREFKRALASTQAAVRREI